MPRLRLIEAFVIIRDMKSSGVGECEMTAVSRSVCHGRSVIVKAFRSSCADRRGRCDGMRGVRGLCGSFAEIGMESELCKKR